MIFYGFINDMLSEKNRLEYETWIFLKNKRLKLKIENLEDQKPNEIFTETKIENWDI